MEPSFAKVVDPVFLGTIALLDRIGRGAAEAPEQERAALHGLISRAEAGLGDSEEWKLAKYALVSWIDSALIEAPWAGAEWWEDHVLEREYFHDRQAFTEFYVRAREAAELTRKNALEVYYLCVVMGFRGLYSDASSTQLAADLGLPASLDSWAKATTANLHLGIGRPPIQGHPRPVEGAPPLDGKSSLVMTSIFALISVALSLGYFVSELMR